MPEVEGRTILSANLHIVRPGTQLRLEPPYRQPQTTKEWPLPGAAHLGAELLIKQPAQAAHH